MNSPDPSPSPKKPTVARRQVREATVQLMHSAQSNTEGAGDPWPLILAQPEAKIVRARARAILHLQQNRPGRLKKVHAQRAVALPLIESYLEEKSAPRNFRQILTSEEKLPELLDLLRRQLKSEKEPDAISETMERIREANKSSLDALTALETALGPLEACPEPLKHLAKALPPLRETGDLLRSLLSETLPELREVDALREAIAERDLFQSETESLHQLVTIHLADSDKLIAEHLENFAPDRLAQVDRAVLRLAVTELRHCPDIPPAVSINEAIEVARRFGGIESAGFVNGILDKLK
ncbi:MAG: transcription antitermination factor NusB [Roseibacillus sp.]